MQSIKFIGIDSARPGWFSVSCY